MGKFYREMQYSPMVKFEKYNLRMKWNKNATLLAADLCVSKMSTQKRITKIA